jgi:hypothetical protein
MSVFKELYDGLKDLVQLAQKLKNQDIMNLANDIQAKLFEFKDENETLRDENRELLEQLKRYTHPLVEESNIKYSPRGFFTINNELPKIPYCSACWRREKMLIPLAQVGTWWQYKCSSCKTDIVVLDENGKDINNK